MWSRSTLVKVSAVSGAGSVLKSTAEHALRWGESQQCNSLQIRPFSNSPNSLISEFSTAKCKRQFIHGIQIKTNSRKFSSSAKKPGMKFKALKTEFEIMLEIAQKNCTQTLLSSRSIARKNGKSRRLRHETNADRVPAFGRSKPASTSFRWPAGGGRPCERRSAVPSRSRALHRRAAGRGEAAGPAQRL